MGTGWLAWTTTAATYLASTVTGRYAQVTPEYGIANGSGPDVLISDPSSGKTAGRKRAASPVLPMHVVRPAGLAWPVCRGDRSR